MNGSIQRATQLIDLAGRTEGIPTDLICFVVAPILREHGINCTVVADLFYYESHNAVPNDMETQLFLQVDEKFVDATGAYRSIEDAAKEQQRRTGSKKVWSDGYPVFHEAEDEAYAAYERFGYEYDTFSKIVNILRACDDARMLEKITPGGQLIKSKIRL